MTGSTPSQPFWISTMMRSDPLCFVDRGAGDATASLLFPPSGPVTLVSASGEARFEEGRDFVVDAASASVIRPPGSRIPVTRLDQLDPSIDHEEGDFFHRRQVSASYAHRSGLWTGHVPRFGGRNIPRTLGLLQAGAPVSIAVTGDSISEGYNASGFLGVPPHQPPYAGLLAAGLMQAYGSPVAVNNFAVAGWSSDHGLGDADRVGDARPDLVVVAFGMNDAGYATPADFSANIAGILGEIRGRAREAEFVLVAPMLPNPEWHYPVMARFPAYRDALADLCGEGVALADVTAMWSDLLKRKSVYDLTGNGINHPNDFGHRVYAETILALLIAC